MKKFLKRTRKARLKIHYFGINVLTFIAGIVLASCFMVDDFNDLRVIPLWLLLILVSGGWIYLVGSARGLFEEVNNEKNQF